MTTDGDPRVRAPLLTFGVFELDLDASELRRAGRRVRLAPQPYRALVHLVRNAGRLVTREEMRTVIWGHEEVVDFDRGLNVCIAQVRDALRDSARAARFVETVPRRGYRFVAEVGTGNGGPHAGATAGDEPPGRAAAHHTDAAARGGRFARVAGRTRRRRWVAAWTVAAALIVTSVVAMLLRHDRDGIGPSAAPGRVMIAVLPITPLSGDPDAALTSAGLTDELITRLGGLAPEALGVIARTSVEAYAGSGADVREIADRLRVGYILEGSLRRDGALTRVSAALIDGESGGQLWSASFDANEDRVLALQGDIALRIARSLVPALVSPDIAERLAGRIPPPEAERQYLNGRRLVGGRGVEDLLGARDAFADAVHIAPTYGLAYAGLAEAWYSLATRGHESDGVDPYARAREAAARAVALDSTIASAHLTLGAVAMWRDWELDAAGAHIARALARNPSDPAAHHDHGWWLLLTGRPGEAVAALETAVRLDPLSPRAVLDVGWALLRTRDYDGAVEAGRRTLALVPDHRGARFCMHRALFLAGRHEEAYAALRETLPESADSLRAHLDALPAREAYLANLKHDVERRIAGGEASVRSAYDIAVVFALLDERDRALRWLERARARREGAVITAHVDPAFDALAGEPRYRELLRRIGVAPAS